jgi:hypothetical protein
MEKKSEKQFVINVDETLSALDTLPNALPFWREELGLRRINLKRHKITVVFKAYDNVYEVMAIAAFHALQKPNKYSKKIVERFKKL